MRECCGVTLTKRDGCEVICTQPSSAHTERGFCYLHDKVARGLTSPSASDSCANEDTIRMSFGDEILWDAKDGDTYAFVVPEASCKAA